MFITDRKMCINIPDSTQSRFYADYILLVMHQRLTKMIALFYVFLNME